jgi:hypothetical protein
MYIPSWERPRNGRRASLVDHVKSYANSKGAAYGTAAYDEPALEHFHPHPICKLSCLIVVVADGRQSSLVSTFCWRCFFLRLLCDVMMVHLKFDGAYFGKPCATKWLW